MGVSSDNSNSDIEVAMAGGSTFEQRVAELATAKQALMDAYSDLGLGQSAKAEWTKAQDAQAKAVKALDEAKATAAASITKANNEAIVIVHAAKVRADELRRAVNADVEARAAGAAAMQASAKMAQEQALKALADAEKQKAELDALSIRRTALIAEAEDAAEAHNTEAERLKAIREKTLLILASIDKG